METLLDRAKKLRADYPDVKKVALAYSGGLDSVVVGRLLSEAGFAVIPIVVKIGQHSDFARIDKNARSLFKACRVSDARERFAESVFRAIKSGFGEGRTLNSDGITRPALALSLVEAAREERCQAIAHGSSGTGDGHLIMENSLRVLAPEMRIIAPVRDMDLRRDEALLFAKKEKLPTNLNRAEKFSADENLWGRTVRQGEALDPSSPLPADAYKWTVSPKNAPDRPANLEIEFLNGIPVSATINGRKTAGAVAILQALNETGGKHGVGRSDSLDDKIVGLKAREMYECPSASILIAAHRELEGIVLTTKELEAKRQVDSLWGSLVHAGGWYTRLRRSLDAFIDETERAVDGTVTLELYKGSIIVKGRKSPHALYDTRLSSRDSKGVFSQKEARHFAKLYGLQEVIAYMVDVDKP